MNWIKIEDGEERHHPATPARVFVRCRGGQFYVGHYLVHCGVGAWNLPSHYDVDGNYGGETTYDDDRAGGGGSRVTHWAEIEGPE